jgi:hypothetical protein
MRTWALLLIALNSTLHPHDISLAEIYYPWHVRPPLYRGKILKSVFPVRADELRRSQL